MQYDKNQSLPLDPHARRLMIDELETMIQDGTLSMAPRNSLSAPARPPFDSTGEYMVPNWLLSSNSKNNPNQDKRPRGELLPPIHHPLPPLSSPSTNTSKNSTKSTTTTTTTTTTTSRPSSPHSIISSRELPLPVPSPSVNHYPPLSLSSLHHSNASSLHQYHPPTPSYYANTEIPSFHDSLHDGDGFLGARRSELSRHFDVRTSVYGSTPSALSPSYSPPSFSSAPPLSWRHPSLSPYEPPSPSPLIRSGSSEPPDSPQQVVPNIPFLLHPLTTTLPNPSGPLRRPSTNGNGKESIIYDTGSPSAKFQVKFRDFKANEYNILQREAIQHQEYKNQQQLLQQQHQQQLQSQQQKLQQQQQKQQQKQLQQQQQNNINNANVNNNGNNNNNSSNANPHKNNPAKSNFHHITPDSISYKEPKSTSGERKRKTLEQEMISTKASRNTKRKEYLSAFTNQYDMVKHAAQNSQDTRPVPKPPEVPCDCGNPEALHHPKTQCRRCGKWIHVECEKSDPSNPMCAECRPPSNKINISDLIINCEEVEPQEEREEVEEDEDPLEEEGGGIKIGNQIVSISTLAKQPWLDGWATARSLALKYLKESKKMEKEINITRKLPKQIVARTASKGKKGWRQAEVLLAIQFLKASELVQTSTKKGTLIRDNSMSLEDLIETAKNIEMPKGVGR